MSMPARRLTLAAAGFGGAITLGTVFLPFVHFAYRNRTAHVALDAIEAVIGLVAAYLIFGRFRERLLARDGLLVYGLVVLATTNIALSLVPHTVFGARSALLGWISLIAREIGALALMLAALMGRRALPRRKDLSALFPLAGVGTVVLAAGVMIGLNVDLPFGVRTIDASTSAQPQLQGHPALLAAQLSLVVIFAIASVGFTREAERTDDPLLRWLGAGTALASIARVNFFLFPSIYSSFIYTGDLLRFGFYAALLAGASAEVRRYWQQLERDRDEREHLIAELQSLSLTDPLTGLSNRRAFFSVANQQLKLYHRTGTAFRLLFVDVNDMKTINDAFGHTAGDDALRTVAETLRTSFRRSDIVARIGGDEFCVLMAEGDPAPAIERLHVLLGGRQENGEDAYPLSVSVGVATFDPTRHSSVDDLVADADDRMYVEKGSGQSRSGRGIRG
jgi:diguanylate cyclase (GGDEF)-like protein